MSLLLLPLCHNGLTKSSSSLISNIVLSFKVEELSITGNDTVGENEKLYAMLSHPSSLLTELNMSNASLSSIAARTLFGVIKDVNKLKTFTLIPMILLMISLVLLS